MAEAVQVPKVKRVRRVSAQTTQQPPPEGTYRGFGAQGAETDDEFQDRMFEIPALEAAIYEMERNLERPQRITVNELFPIP